MTLTPEGGAAIPVSVTTTRKVQGGAAIPVYGYMTAPTDGRPAMGGSAIPVRVLTAADLKQNGGQWTLEGRPYAMPVYTAPASTVVQGGAAIAVYPVNAWPTVAAPVVPPVPVWAPTDIAGLALWLKADSGLYQDAAKTVPCAADGDAIYTWADQSGQGRDVVQAVVVNRPTYKVNIQNGKPGVRFGGTDDYLQNTAVTNLMQPNTIFIVSTRSANLTTDRILFGSNDDSNRNQIQHAITTGNGMMYAGAVLDGGATLGTTPLVLTCVFNGASSSMRKNGAAYMAGNAGAMAQNGFSIGSDRGPSAYFGGDIMEVLFYNALLDAAQIAQVETYLNGATRWAVY